LPKLGPKLVFQLLLAEASLFKAILPPVLPPWPHPGEIAAVSPDFNCAVPPY
jgi:hypothetical protein